MKRFQTIAPIAFIIFNLFLVFAIPIVAWRGFPKRFTRLNWIGVSLLTFVVGSIMIWFANFSEQGNYSMAVAMGTFGIVLLAGALGSFGAIFFYNKKEQISGERT
jgi:apolipoprotein N-acyltransferase